ncbi:TIGR01777 family protein [Pseudodesulfovibrio sp. JC047]|uniref:TIGR01777 family oxidoreductase n=1 Tax=Pseudodesulfovibrio sp. JC047 TaxID=2683199 RepID=UPI0013D25099|nr:TIGR01777 family oxidoreductase [Pseudodesulfovibrio sp. JC047]NDV19922.1 TIGR01777 family protein [Pseudodesulfovibrio sp. JC047]
MRALIAGGTGFIGQALVEELKNHGWEIVILSRRPAKVADTFETGVIGLNWDNGDWPALIGPETAIINLAGANIAAGRWTTARKQQILDSRVKTGTRLVQAIKDCGALPSVMIQASAVGYYGPCDQTPVDEDTPSGTGFLADVTRQWEASTAELETMGVRRCLLRTGMVLGNGGALERMLPPFKFYMGGPLGSGQQGVSWIHLADEVKAIRFLLENTATHGPYNLTAPEPVLFRDFAKALGTVLGRPSAMKIPGTILRLFLGEMADELLLSGQMAHPTRLRKAGYKFAIPTLEHALQDILS